MHIRETSLIGWKIIETKLADSKKFFPSNLTRKNTPHDEEQQNVLRLFFAKNKLNKRQNFMKTKLLFLIIATFIGINTISAQTEKEVARIRNEVTLINKNAKTYSKINKDVEGISLEGTTATYFVSGKGLKKITAKLYGETYNASVELFYSGEQLIFAYQKMNRYDTQIGLEKPVKVVKVEEKRLYFVNENMVKLLIGKANIKKSNDKWQESVDEIIDIANKLKTAYED